MKRIKIIGGGLAGLALGIELRRRDVPATIIEAGTYPRHRVCGEFISGRGVGLLQQMANVEFRPAQTVALFAGKRSAGGHRLPQSAMCVSRFMLDAALAQVFQELAGELRLEQRAAPDDAEGTVIAAGRRPCATSAGWRWFGLKAHATGVELSADLEMHLASNGYVGLCRLPSGEVNVCGLFRRSAGESARGSSREWLRGSPGSVLFRRLQHASFADDSFCAVAGLSLSPQPIDPCACRIGDALTMIPPITGNGMSMAFESAALAADVLDDYARGMTTWSDATRQLAEAINRAFTGRLRWAAHLHQLLFSRAGAFIAPLLFRATPVWRASFSATR